MSAGAPDATAAVNVCYIMNPLLSVFIYQLQQGTTKTQFFFVLAK